MTGGMEPVGCFLEEEVGPPDHLMEVEQAPRARSIHSTASDTLPTASPVASLAPWGRRCCGSGGGRARHPSSSLVTVTPGSVPIAVLLRPRFGGCLVAAWLTGIIVSLLMMTDYYDIALRDFGLVLAALTLARLAAAFPSASLWR